MGGLRQKIIFWAGVLPGEHVHFGLVLPSISKLEDPQIGKDSDGDSYHFIRKCNIQGIGVTTHTTAQSGPFFHGEHDLIRGYDKSLTFGSYRISAGTLPIRSKTRLRAAPLLLISNPLMTRYSILHATIQTSP
jgi:hypothetical protein